MVHGLVIMALVNVVNISVSWAFCLGLGPCPQWGWKGIAFGTACGYTVGGLATLLVLGTGLAGLRLRWLMFRPKWALLYRLLRVGIPGGIDTLSVIFCQLWFVAVVNALGDRSAAAHGVALRIESLAFLPGAAFQVAAATMTGQYLGAKQPHKATRGVIAACVLAGLVMGSAAVIFFSFPLQLARLMVGEHQQEVAQLAAPLLRTIALGIPPLVLLTIFSGALRGAGDTRYPMVISWLGLLGVRLPGAHLLALSTFTLPILEMSVAGWGLGVLGAWYAMVADLYVRAALTTWRFWHGGWKTIRV